MNESAQPVFSEVLSRAVQARGLSLDRIRARLEAAGVPVSNATLSYWQSGRSLPTRARSLRTLVELEQILQLETGTLIELIRTADGRTRHHLFAWQNVMPSADIAEQIISDMGMDATGRISRIAVHDTLTVGANRSELAHLTRQVLRAERTGVRSFPVVYQMDGAEPYTPEFEATMGARVGQIVEVPERQLTICEMVFVRPLQRGELVAVEYSVTCPDNVNESSRLVRAAPDPLREVVLAVEFHPQALPLRVESFVQASIKDDPESTADVSGVNVYDDQAQVVRVDATPGVYGLRWHW